jgi:hypothetical protein
MKLFLFSLCFLVISVKAQPIAVSNPEIMFNAFAQGMVAGGGNCAAIAICKSAILTFGVHGVFTETHTADTYNIVLKTGEKLFISDQELSLAIKESGFLVDNFAGYTTNDSLEKRLITDYAYLCYAVMGKMVMLHGDGQHDLVPTADENGFVDSCRYYSYKNALYDLNDGGYTPTNYHLLGLDEYVYVPHRWTNTKSIHSGISWSTGHAIFIRKGHYDDHGTRRRLWMRVQSSGRLFLYPEKQKNHGKRKPFSTC